MSVRMIYITAAARVTAHIRSYPCVACPPTAADAPAAAPAASSIAGFLFVLGIFKTVALDAPAALATNAAVGGSTLVVTAVTNPFLGMLAGIVVRMLGL